MGEIENLNINIQETNKQLDVLDKKIDTVAQSTNEYANSNTHLNVSMVAMNQAISNLGSAVPSLTSAFQLYKTTQQQVNIACKAFAANPVGATIQLIATALAIINAIIDKFKERIASSAELTDKWNKATAALEPIMKAFNEVLDVIVSIFIDFIGVITDGIEWIGKFADSVAEFFGGSGSAYTDAAKKAKDYAKLQKQIDDEERKRIEERGKSERKQGELREQIANAEGENKKKLLEALKEEIKLQTEAEIALNKKRIALLEYKQSLGPTSDAELKALAELKAQTDKLVGEQGKQLAKIDKQINAIAEASAKAATKATSDAAKTAKDAAKAAADAALKEIEAFTKRVDKILKVTDNYYSAALRNLNAETEYVLALNKKAGASEEELHQERKRRLLEEYNLYEDVYKQKLITLQEASEKALNLSGADLKEYQKFIDELNKLEEEKTESNKLAIESMQEVLKVNARKFLEQSGANLEAFDKYIEEIANLLNERTVNIYKYQTEQIKLELEERERLEKEWLEKGEELYEQRQAALDYELEEYKKHIEELEEEFQNSLEGSVEYINETIDTIIDNFDQLSRPQQMLFDMIGRTTAQIGKEIKAFHDLSGEEKNAAAKTKLAMGVIGDAMNAATQTVNAFMAAKQSQIEQDLKNGKITEEQAKKEFEKTKKVQIAMAVMGMMGGIAQAISQAMQLGPIAGPIVGAINAALVATTAGIQIAKIKQLTLENANSGDDGFSLTDSGGITNVTASVNPLLDEDFDLANMNQSTTTQGNSATTDQRVYIVEDDIQESNRRVEVRENTTTF